MLHPMPANRDAYTRRSGWKIGLSLRYACLISSSHKDAMETFARMFRWHMPTPADIMKHGRGKLQERDIIVSEAKVDLTKGDQNPMDNVSFFDYPESTEKKTVPRHHISAMFPECNRVSCPMLLSPPLVTWLFESHSIIAAGSAHYKLRHSCANARWRRAPCRHCTGLGSVLTPGMSRMQEHWCRVFTRNSAPEVVEATQAAMREFLREQYGARVEACTPIRKKRPVAEPCGPAEVGEPPSARKRILTFA